MIETVHFHLQKGRLRAKARKLAKWFSKAIAEARLNRSYDQENDAELEYFHERTLLDEEFMVAHSNYLIAAADRLLLPTPPFERSTGVWVETTHLGRRYHLSLEAQQELRRSIRREKSERSEQTRLWLTCFTGIIGALIGLAAVLLHSGSK